MIRRKHGKEETKIFIFLRNSNFIIIEFNYYNLNPSEENALRAGLICPSTGISNGKVYLLPPKIETQIVKSYILVWKIKE